MKQPEQVVKYVPVGTFAALAFLGWSVVFLPPPQAVAGVTAATTSSAITHTRNSECFI